VGDDEFRFRPGSAREPDQLRRRDALPGVSETAPARDAVEIGEDANSRQMQEFFVVPADGLVYQSENTQIPFFESQPRRAGSVQNRPFFGARLARWNSVGAVRIGTHNDTRIESGRASNLLCLIFGVSHEEILRY